MVHICPKCKSEKVSVIYYSCPAQATCAACGYHYKFGSGIRVVGIAEGMRLRPRIYEEYTCRKCGGYTGPSDPYAELSEEDRNALCKCTKDK